MEDNMHWVFFLCDKKTKNVVAGYQAPHHPCYGNGANPNKVPTPFGNYDHSSYDAIVINLSSSEIAAMKIKYPDSDLLGIIHADYEIDHTSTAPWTTEPQAVGLSEGWDIAYLERIPVTALKAVIPKPSYVQCKKLKLKGK